MEVVGYFRGNLPSSALDEPWAYRPLAPFLASLLPAEPLTALNILNMAALAVSVTCIVLIVRNAGMSGRYQLLAGMMFAVSFPTFWYGAIGYVDPVALAFISVSALLIQLRRYWWVVPLLLVGVMAKESVVIVIPALFVASRRRRVLTLMAILACISGLLAIRAMMPAPAGMGEFPWHLRLDLVDFNASRLRFWAAVSLTLLPVALPLWAWAAGKIKQSDRWMLAGIASGIGLMVYSVVSVYADGRPAWMMYPFLVPLATFALWRVGMGLKPKAGICELPGRC